jgi:hypothetical protein
MNKDKKKIQFKKIIEKLFKEKGFIGLHGFRKDKFTSCYCECKDAIFLCDNVSIETCEAVSTTGWQEPLGDFLEKCIKNN